MFYVFIFDSVGGVPMSPPWCDCVHCCISLYIYPVIMACYIFITHDVYVHNVSLDIQSVCSCDTAFCLALH